MGIFDLIIAKILKYMYRQFNFENLKIWTTK